MSEPAKPPQGIVAIFVGPDGREVATATDFDRSGYGGFTQYQAQELRVNRALAGRVMNALCNPQIGKHLSDYHQSEIIREMCRKDGYRVHLIPIGYEDADVS